MFYLFWFATIFWILAKLYDVLRVNTKGVVFSPTEQFFFTMTVFFYIQIQVTMMMIFCCESLVALALKNTLKRCLCESLNTKKCEVILKTSMMYCKICDVFKAISQVCAFSLIPYFAAFVYYNLLFFYGVFIYQMNPSDQLFYFTLLTFVWISLYAPTVFCLYAASSKVLTDSKTAINIVQQIIAETKDPVLLKNATFWNFCWHISVREFLACSTIFIGRHFSACLEAFFHTRLFLFSFMTFQRFKCSILSLTLTITGILEKKNESVIKCRSFPSN